MPLSPLAPRGPAWTVARAALIVGALILGTALVAGGVRMLPLALARDVPAELVPGLARGVVELALETTFFVTPAVATALACGRWNERGDARGLAALGVSPVGVLFAAWPALAALLVGGAAASFAWGGDAAAPGRAVSALVARARAACSASDPGAGLTPPRAVSVPLAGVAWVCFPGEAPRVVAALGAGALAASDATIGDDGRSIRLRDAAWATRATGGAPEVRLRAAIADVRGFGAVGLPRSNLSPIARAVLFPFTAIALAIAAGVLVIARGTKGLRALALGVAGPAAALVTLGSLEASTRGVAPYATVPAVGLVAVFVAAVLAGRVAAPVPRW